ncbi:MAG: phenylalanine--tRNA ligase subunit beta [Legionellales bacterium]|nr:phenylalanine--tRNA ligase subunit beta [Legionellales bacterium]
MLFSLNWLKKWIDIDCEHSELISKLAMAGFEVDSLKRICDEFSKVVVAKIDEVIMIPDSPDVFQYKLRVEDNKLVNIISRIADLELGTNVAFSPNGVVINKITVNTQSEYEIQTDGIICTEKDLGISDCEKVIVFDSSIPLGADVYQELNLDDYILDVDITPNRGDCLSVKGMSREIGAIFNQRLHPPDDIDNKPVEHHSDKHSVKINEVGVCPNFNTRIIYDINSNVVLPLQFTEKLRRSGINSVSPIVDIVNYVMIELGQPMHAYDLEKISGDIQVRFANKAEEIVLIDGNKKNLTEDTLVISDNENAIGIAGVMGGEFTSVTNKTKSIVLESAYFNPHKLIGKARNYGLSSDSAFRFERGVCPLLQTEALDRASFLITHFCGGRVGPINEVTTVDYLPQPKLIKFRHSRCQQMLGIDISAVVIRDIFSKLNFTVMENNGDLDIRVPSYRFDLNLEVDLIEEVARIYGYERIIGESSLMLPRRAKINDIYNTKRLIRNSMKYLAYNEAITYSFVDPNLQNKICENKDMLNLLNPISPELSQMRASVLPGLIQALIHNKNRQIRRAKLFEIGQCFSVDSNNKVQHTDRLAGICYGELFDEQWGITNREFDFFDLKKDVENILIIFNDLEQFSFEPISVKFLHPGQSAKIVYQQEEIGYIGMLHPQTSIEFGFKEAIFVFELNIEKIQQIYNIEYKNMSIYPELRRDISFFIDKDILSYELIKEIKKLSCSFLNKVSIFDIYQDPKKETEKSIALSLILRDTERTLTDSEVDSYLEQVINRLEQKFNIKLRKE